MLIIRESSKHDETYTFLVRKEKKKQPMVTWLITCHVTAVCINTGFSPVRSPRGFLFILPPSVVSQIDKAHLVPIVFYQCFQSQIWRSGETLSSFFRELGELPAPSPAPPCCRLKRPTCSAFIVPYNIWP